MQYAKNKIGKSVLKKKTQNIAINNLEVFFNCRYCYFNIPYN